MGRAMEFFDVVVIGGGPAGMAAALQCTMYNVQCTVGDEDARDVGARGLRVLLVERGDLLGGILNQCTHLGFGLSYFGEELTGQEYARRFATRIEASGVEVFTDTTVLEVGADRVITISGGETGFRRISAGAVVLATGCRERPIGALPVAGSRPTGIFTAGAAQKMLNLGGYDIGARFVILGSGDVGLIVARELALRGKDVIAVIEKKAECGGLERNRINCLERFGIPLVTRTTVSEVHGMPRISGVTVTDVSGGRRFIECDTLITSVGLIPERELLEWRVESGEWSVRDEGTRGVPGWLFLCGNAAFVHDVVDDVSFESERVGGLAAASLQRDSAVSGGDASGELGDVGAQDGVQGGVGVICLACPKECVGVLGADGWLGLACGRESPG